MAAFVMNIVLIVMEIVGTVLAFIGTDIMPFYYYTIDSNIFAMISSIAFVCYYLKRDKNEKMPGWLGFMRLVAALNLALTFFIVIFVFVPMSVPYGMGAVAQITVKGAQPYHHLLCPILTVISYIFLEKGEPASRKTKLLAVIPTFVYAIVLIICNIARLLVGPYPFFHVYEQPVWASVMWGLGILAMAWLFGVMITGAKKKHMKKIG